MCKLFSLDLWETSKPNGTFHTSLISVLENNDHKHYTHLKQEYPPEFEAIAVTMKKFSIISLVAVLEHFISGTTWIQLASSQTGGCNSTHNIDLLLNSIILYYYITLKTVKPVGKKKVIELRNLSLF